ncbi:MAG: hypothetical protein H6Q74_3057 [Firmicutes bacterium]|nr:hypothetical protein [Bacillota bacterium]
MQSSMPMEKVKLHIGCGNTKINGFINIDVRQTAATDLVWDINLPVPFGSIECTFSNAFFEHIYRNKRLSHLADIYNKLTDTGFVCYIGIPYFKNIAKFYLENQPGTAGSVFNLYNVYRYTHGDPEKVLPDNYLAQLHKSLFDEQELMQLLSEAGFTNYIIFSYGFPGDYVELPVTMGFFAVKQSENQDLTKKVCVDFLKNFEGIYLRMNSLKFLDEKDSMNGFPPCIKIQTPLTTIKYCQALISAKKNGAYMRFGDGDVNLLECKDDMLQAGNKEIAGEMQEAFSLTGEGIVKCLPLHSQKFGMEPGMKPGVHEGSDQWAENILSRVYKYFIGEKIYSHVALAYLAVFESGSALEFLRFLKILNPIFVGNENVPPLTITKLFGNTVHIKAPSQNSFGDIDRIEQETVQAYFNRKKNYDVIVVAMGCSGRILEKRLLKNHGLNAFLFDFGSLLDAFCGWNTRAWIELASLPQAYWENMINKI